MLPFVFWKPFVDIIFLLFLQVERRNIRGAMKGRVKIGLGLTIGADIEEVEDTEETLMDDEDNSENVMEETAAEDAGPAPVMVKLTARHYDVHFKDDDELFNVEKEFQFECMKCDQKFDSILKLKEHDKLHRAESGTSTTNIMEQQIKPKLSKSEQTKLRVNKFRKLKKMREEKDKGDNKSINKFGSQPTKNNKGNAKKLKKAKRLQESVSSALDNVTNEGLVEDVERKETRDVKCDQCGELFESVQTLNVHKFQNAC